MKVLNIGVMTGFCNFAVRDSLLMKWLKFFPAISCICHDLIWNYNFQRIKNIEFHSPSTMFWKGLVWICESTVHVYQMSNLELISHIFTNKQQQNLVLKSWHLKKIKADSQKATRQNWLHVVRKIIFFSHQWFLQRLLADSERTSPPFIIVQDQGINH